MRIGGTGSPSSRPCSDDFALKPDLHGGPGERLSPAIPPVAIPPTTWPNLPGAETHPLLELAHAQRGVELEQMVDDLVGRMACRTSQIRRTAVPSASRRVAANAQVSIATPLVGFRDSWVGSRELRRLWKGDSGFSC